jgi:hypothetical protein
LPSVVSPSDGIKEEDADDDADEEVEAAALLPDM